MPVGAVEIVLCWKSSDMSPTPLVGEILPKLSDPNKLLPMRSVGAAEPGLAPGLEERPEGLAAPPRLAGREPPVLLAGLLPLVPGLLPPLLPVLLPPRLPPRLLPARLDAVFSGILYLRAYSR